MNNYNFPLLRRLIGTTVTTYDAVPDTAPPDPTSSLVPPLRPLSLNAPAGNPRKWVIKEKLSEDIACLTEEEVKSRMGSSKTVGKFLCSPVDNNDPSQMAFMRIYQQIPIAGTEDSDLDTLAQQAIPPPGCGELESFKLLKGCRAAPRFLGYATRTQEEHELLPGGYVLYIVWGKVPGEPLTEELFWNLDRSVRDDIRSKFRATYDTLRSSTRWSIQHLEDQKIIYDQPTGELHIPGFRGAWPVIDDFEWLEGYYVEFGLAKPGKEMDWYLHPGKWEW